MCMEFLKYTIILKDNLLPRIHHHWVLITIFEKTQNELQLNLDPSSWVSSDSYDSILKVCCVRDTETIFYYPQYVLP